MKKNILRFGVIGIISVFIVLLFPGLFVNKGFENFDRNKKITNEPNEDWLTNVKNYIEKDEYNFEYDNSNGKYTTFNRKNNLRFTYSSNGFKTEPGITKIPLFDMNDKSIIESKKKYKELPFWQTEINLEGYGRNITKRFCGKNIILKDNIATIEDDNLKINYFNDESGMRQDFIIKNRPEGNGKLLINLNIITKEKIKIEKDGIKFIKAKTGKDLYSYNGLKVWDNKGRKLEGRFNNENKEWLKNKNKKINIEIEDADAEYPVTIDPLSSTPNWTATGENANDNFGISVSTTGDVNGDGYGDVIIGASGYSGNRGKVYEYHGGMSGLSSTPNWTAAGENANDYFGCSVSSAGDVNGDGYSDVIIGAYGFTSNTGKVYVYRGSASGLPVLPNWIAMGEYTNDKFGFSVSTAGDVNGDGYSDVIIGAYLGASCGKVYVYNGSSSGLSSTANWTAVGQLAADYFGSSVSTAGDVNGEGYSDVIVGAIIQGNFNGKVYAYYGSASGLSLTANWTATGENANDQLGCSVSSAGDINGDGYSDVIVGANKYSGNKGKVYVYYGSFTGLPSTPNWTTLGENTNDEFGWAVSTAGDINGDGICDFIIGARGYSGFKGKVYIYSGNLTGISSIPVWTATGENANDRYGSSLFTAGDVNGDGISDVIIGAYANNGKGKVYVYHGSPSGLTIAPSWTATGENASDQFGYSVSSAGDINGDGYNDIIIGAYGYSGGKGRAYVFNGRQTGFTNIPSWMATGENANDHFGCSVSTAGDINGDGYSDIIIGAGGNGSSKGKVYEFNGSASGLSTTSNWTVTGVNTGYYYFGNSVSTAGDVNGDGFSDVLVGEYGYDGKVYAYYGSSSGLSLTPSWTATGDALSNFGSIVTSAGDVNGDGYSDVMIGEIGYLTSRGKVFLYYGSSTGLPSTPSWTATGENTNDGFGFSVSTAGDVNGDGINDVIIGACYYPNANYKGKVYVYHGSPSGLSGTPNWTATGENANDYFGCSVSTAGDVNGDGYSDVIVGALGYSSTKGKVYLFYGSSSGLSLTPNWTATGENSINQFGCSVSTAGDINGDGYSDVVIGARYYSGSTGKVYVFYGDSIGMRSTLQQSRPGTNLVIAPGGNTTLLNQVRLSMFCRSPFGRTKGKLVYEYRQEVLPFTGYPITNSTSYTGMSSNWTNLTVSGVQINNDITGVPANHEYKWRVRVKYNLASNPYQVYGPWKYYKNYAPIPNGGFKPAFQVGIRKIETEIPNEFKLFQNYPNPFNPVTNIRYQIANNTFVCLKIFDVLGKEVETLVNEKMDAGTYSVEWNARQGGSSTLASGIYFYQLKTKDFSDTKKLVLLK